MGPVKEQLLAALDELSMDLPADFFSPNEAKLRALIEALPDEPKPPNAEGPVKGGRQP